MNQRCWRGYVHFHSIIQSIDTFFSVSWQKHDIEPYMKPNLMVLIVRKLHESTFIIIFHLKVYWELRFRSCTFCRMFLILRKIIWISVPDFFLLFHKSTAQVFLLPCTWDWGGGGKVQWILPAPFSLSNIYAITILNIVHNIQYLNFDYRPLFKYNI